MITEDQVIEAYRAKLRLEVRRMLIENTRLPTMKEIDEEVEVTAELDGLHLQYVAQHVA